MTLIATGKTGHSMELICLKVLSHMWMLPVTVAAAVTRDQKNVSNETVKNLENSEMLFCTNIFTKI